MNDDNFMIRCIFTIRELFIYTVKNKRRKRPTASNPYDDVYLYNCTIDV